MLWPGREPPSTLCNCDQYVLIGQLPSVGKLHCQACNVRPAVQRRTRLAGGTLVQKRGRCKCENAFALVLLLWILSSLNLTDQCLCLAAPATASLAAGMTNSHIYAETSVHP